jgi:hypothetical protein
LLAKPRLDVLERLIQPRLLRQVIALHLTVRGFRNLGVHLLREQLLRRDAFLFRFRLDELLIDQLVQRLALDLIFLLLELPQLPLDQR